MITLSNESKEALKQGESYLKKNDINGFLNDIFYSTYRGEICSLFYETGMLKYMKSIPKWFFSHEQSTKIVIPSNIEELETEAFSESIVKDVVIEDGVKVIGKSCFHNSDLRSIKLPNTLVTIGTGAFSNCANLKEIFIPDSVQSLGAYAFDGCDDIKIYITPMSKRGNKLRFKKSDYEFLKDHVVGIETGEGE